MKYFISFEEAPYTIFRYSDAGIWEYCAYQNDSLMWFRSYSQMQYVENQASQDLEQAIETLSAMTDNPKAQDILEYLIKGL